MAPERSPKRQKTSKDIETSPKTTQPTQIPLPPDSPTSDLTQYTEPAGNQTQRSSWYSSWSRKAPPMAQAARDSINSARSAASEVASSIRDASSTPKSVRSPSLAMTLGKGRPSRASLADATTTMVHAEAKSPARKSSKPLSIRASDIPAPQETMAKVESTRKKQEDEARAAVVESQRQKEETSRNIQQELQSQPSGWLGWLAKGDGPTTDQGKSAPESETERSPNIGDQNAPKLQMQEIQRTTATSTSSTGEIQATRKGWLPIWGAGSTGSPQAGESTVEFPKETSAVSASKVGQEPATYEPPKEQRASQTQPESSSIENSTPPALPHDGNKASAWAFWSRDRKANNSSTSVDSPREGEIAVSNTPSQNHPRRASFSVPKSGAGMKAKPMPEAKKLDLQKPVTADKTANAAPKKAETATSASHKKQGSKPESNTVVTESANATAVAVEPTESNKSVSIKSAQVANNLLLPELHTTLKLPESPSILLRLASLLYVAKEPELSHLSLVKEPPRIKNALAIGVHGYFPTPLIRSVLGQPTGTSIKFADMAAKSIKRWTSAHGYECQVKTAALEGEGKIAERIELLWKLLLNWIDEIRSSDFIMVACHSQGVPVAIMLVARLIQFGCVGSARICICAMAGVNMGPFQEYKSRWIGGSAAELFEFSDPSSRVSINYMTALDVALKFGVHLTFIGSIDDQLVSLESSIYSALSHPHIFRAVSIDSRVHAPNFLSHLVGFALKLRNLGVQDHGLIRELSSPLAGSLYTGEGHSRIYEDDAVYDLAVSFSMETTSLVGIPLTQRTVVAGGSNPYILPFAMRGILEEDSVKNELQNEVSDLLKEFDEWKPNSKVLKDVKFRLEGIRSQL